MRARGGAAFFERSGWQAELLGIVNENDRGAFETEKERRSAIYEELDRLLQPYSGPAGRP